MTKILQLSFAVWLLVSTSTLAGPVRAVFLNDDAVLKDTLEILRRSGCTEAAVANLRKTVRQYNAGPFEFDLSKFPLAKNGFFSFGSMSRLIEVLPHKLSDTRHPYELNCFDTVILLGTGRLKTSVAPDDLVSGLLSPHHATNGGFTILPVATARDAFAQCYPTWYREITESTFLKSDSDQRVCLTASLFRCHVLPLAATENKLAQDVLATLRASWRTTSLRFTKEGEVVLCHQVNFPQRWLATAHSGWLVPRNKGYMYLEKSGGSGPFVRLDLEAKADLKTWFEAIFQGAEKLGYTHHFVTFNQDTIEALDVPRANETRWRRARRGTSGHHDT